MTSSPTVIRNIIDEYSTAYENILEFGFFIISSPVNKNEWELLSKSSKIFFNEPEELQNKLAHGNLHRIACRSKLNKEKLRNTLIYNENVHESLKHTFSKLKLDSTDQTENIYFENDDNNYKSFLGQINSTWQKYLSCGVAVSNMLSKISEVYGGQTDPIIQPHQFMCSNNPTFFSSVLKINNYQSCVTDEKIEINSKKQEVKNQSFSHKLFMAHHVDPNTFVVVQADEHHQIQVFSEKHGWIDPLNSISDNYDILSSVAVVMIGQAATSFTNELLPSTIHRVLCSSTESFSLNFCAMPSEDEAMKLKSRIAMNIPPTPTVYSKERYLESDDDTASGSTMDTDVICPFKEFPLNADDALSHWNLLDAVVGPSPSLPSYKEKEFWCVQIIRYHKYINLYNKFISNNKDPCLKFPDPPREVYYIWLVHMLQPLAYQRDCLELFNRTIPHTNHKPDWAYLFKQDKDFSEIEKMVIMELNCDNLNGNTVQVEDLGHLFTHIDWWMGMDGVTAIYRDIYEYAPYIPLENKKLIQKVSCYYTVSYLDKLYKNICLRTSGEADDISDRKNEKC